MGVLHLLCEVKCLVRHTASDISFNERSIFLAAHEAPHEAGRGSTRVELQGSARGTTLSLNGSLHTCGAPCFCSC